MKLKADRETLLKPLQAVQGVVERRQTLPILSNILLSIEGTTLSVTATDMELELMASAEIADSEPGEITVPARKLIDICRACPPGAEIELAVDGERAVLRSGRSRFTLSTLPATEYPIVELPEAELELSLDQLEVKRLIDLTAFAMAQQDVRYYLNGLLLELTPGQIKAVATDGHRLALAEMAAESGGSGEPRSIIVPRKGITELARLLGTAEGSLDLKLAGNLIRIELPGMRFTSKLIEGKFPDYERVIPDPETCDKQIVVDRESLRQSLTRAAILSNDKYRAIRVGLDKNILRVAASNPEQEEAEDEVVVDYDGEAVEIGFNVSYLIDALSALPAESARLHMTDAASSCLITTDGGVDCRYVVMPMRL